MDANIPNNREELNDLERRLSSWRPGVEGLDADAMLYAAGLAAGRAGRQRLFLGTVAALLAMAAVGLGAWALTERAGRLDLAARLHQHDAAPEVKQWTTTVAQSDQPAPVSPFCYFNMRRRMEQESERTLTSTPSIGSQSMPPPPPTSVLKVGQDLRLLDQ